MQTAIITGPQQIEIQEIGLPRLKPHQILVRVRAVGLCTWEQRFYRGAATSSYPFRGGHEVAGQVVEVGAEAATEVEPGDVVCLALTTRCGSCENCRRGLDNFCLHRNKTGPGQMWGPAGLSEYVVAEPYQVYRANPDLPFEQLALTEPVACVLRSAGLPPLACGDWVIVQGVGTMGLLHVQLLRQRGAQVLVVEPDPVRRVTALALGAAVTLDPLAEDWVAAARERTGGLGARAVFFTAGGAAAMAQGLDALAVGGWLCLYGSVHPPGTLALDPNDIHYRELVLTGTFSHTRASFRQAVAAISAGQIDLSPLVSVQVAFPEVRHGFELAIRPDTYRVVVMFEA
ncbi:MAG: alcohol dehydrogenase catalytic domain-containing protein [Chloroflexota bacterium]